MSETQWVQHKSGQGEKWKVAREADHAYRAVTMTQEPSYLEYWLPKSEYIPCEKPTRWVDVTAHVEVCSDGRNIKLTRIDLPCSAMPPHYRLQKVKLYRCDPSSVMNCEQWAFIVEKEVSHG